MAQNKFDPKKYPFVAKGHKYALDIVEGKIVACKYTIGACERYLKDLNNTASNYYFDAEKAEKYLRLTQKFEHVIGQWEPKNIVYEPWQCWIWMNIYGFRNKVTKLRRFRIAHIEVARGNGKSALASQCSLYELALDSPNGNQISTVATKKEQARIVLDSARAMARKNFSYIKHTGVKVLAHTIVHTASNSVMRALSSEASSLDGLNDVLAVCDELHAMKRDTFETITSGMSKRPDSLTLCITTAGSDVDSVGYSQSAYAKKVCLGEVIDEQFFAVVYCLDEGVPALKIPPDDWTDEKNWIKANPNLGVSVDITTLRAKVEKAKVTPADVPNLKIKHFNMWISEANAFYDIASWDRCADPTLKVEDFKGHLCRVGLDLASHVDLTSVVSIFRKEDIYYIFDRSFIPEASVKAANSVLFDEWVAKGYLISTPGEAINYDKIREEIEAIGSNHKVLEVGYDPWSAEETAQKLSTRFDMIKVGMNVANLSEPMKKLDALMRSGKIRHNGSPLLRWCLGNVVAKEDHNGNVFPRKSHVKLKIDPVVAALLALALWLQTANEESVYAIRGIRTL